MDQTLGDSDNCKLTLGPPRVYLYLVPRDTASRTNVPYEGGAWCFQVRVSICVDISMETWLVCLVQIPIQRQWDLRNKVKLTNDDEVIVPSEAEYTISVVNIPARRDKAARVARSAAAQSQKFPKIVTFQRKAYTCNLSTSFLSL